MTYDWCDIVGALAQSPHIPSSPYEWLQVHLGDRTAIVLDAGAALRDQPCRGAHILYADPDAAGYSRIA